MNWNYAEKNITRAKALRKDMTPHERKLWYCFLRTYPVKVLRQRPIGTYIVDFYCAAAKVAIEVDGSQHYEAVGTAQDGIRDKALSELGVRMLRFSNSEIDRDFSAVKERIHQVMKARMITVRQEEQTQ